MIDFLQPTSSVNTNNSTLSAPEQHIHTHYTTLIILQKRLQKHRVAWPDSTSAWEAAWARPGAPAAPSIDRRCPRESPRCRTARSGFASGTCPRPWRSILCYKVKTHQEHKHENIQGKQKKVSQIVKQRTKGQASYYAKTQTHKIEINTVCKPIPGIKQRTVGRRILLRSNTQKTQKTRIT